MIAKIAKKTQSYNPLETPQRLSVIPELSYVGNKRLSVAFFLALFQDYNFTL